MDNKFEEAKKQYENEIARLRALSKQREDYYQKTFTDLETQKENLLAQYNKEMSTFSIGIERLRGAYTALCDMEEGIDPTLVTNGMMQDIEVEEKQEEMPEETEVPTEETNTEISEETKQKAHELVEKAKEAGKVTSYEEFANSELRKETAVTEEVVEEIATPHPAGEAVLSDEENEALNKVIESMKKEQKPEPKVNPAEVPDYLKEEYGVNK